jgi:23S rRNA pseudouridine2605 synthase
MSAPGPARRRRRGPAAAGEGPRPGRNGAAASPKRSPRTGAGDQGAAAKRRAAAAATGRPAAGRRATAGSGGAARPSAAAGSPVPSGTRDAAGSRGAAGTRGTPGSRGAAGAGGAAGSQGVRAAGGDGVGGGARSGAPDGGEAGGKALRLNKALSAAGLGSRRAVEDLVRAGRVAVDGEVVHDLGRRVDPARDRVTVDGSRVVLDERRRYWLLNKPAGVITTAADPSGRPTVVELVPDQPRVFPVGRLDRDTEGLLLLTNDGPLAYRLTHARYGVEKRYLAEVERLPGNAPARLRKGVELEDGLAKPVRVRVVAGSGRRRMIEVGLVEGRNREVRRLLEAVGAPVRRLVRTAVGPIRLTGLAPGEYRALRPDEIRGLYQATGL